MVRKGVKSRPMDTSGKKDMKANATNQMAWERTPFRWEEIICSLNGIVSKCMGAKGLEVGGWGFLM